MTALGTAMIFVGFGIGLVTLGVFFDERKKHATGKARQRLGVVAVSLLAVVAGAVLSNRDNGPSADAVCGDKYDQSQAAQVAARLNVAQAPGYLSRSQYIAECIRTEDFTIYKP